MRIKCDRCKEWEPRWGHFRYRMAIMTDWEPEPGYDPNLRQFRCPYCGAETYILLMEEVLLKAKEEAQRRDKP
jgi:hypothetical protein